MVWCGFNEESLADGHGAAAIPLNQYHPIGPHTLPPDPDQPNSTTPPPACPIHLTPFGYSDLRSEHVTPMYGTERISTNSKLALGAAAADCSKQHNDTACWRAVESPAMEITCSFLDRNFPWRFVWVTFTRGVWKGVAWYGVSWYESVWQGMAGYGMVCVGMVWYGMVR